MMPRIPFSLAVRVCALVCVLSVLPLRAELFVSSFSGHRVLRYNETNGLPIGTGVFVTAGSGGLNLPHGLAFGPDGHLYVASAGNDAVLRYHGGTGAFLDEFIPSGSGGLDYPVWLEFRPDGFLYVSSQLSHSVLRFQATNGAFAGAFVTNTSGGLNGPSGLTWGTDGHLYVVGRFGNQLLKYDGTNGAFLQAIATDGPLSQPFGVKAGADGHLYVVSGNGNAVARFHGTTGTFLGNFIPSGSGALGLPIDLSFGPNGDLFVASFNNSKVARYNGSTGAFVSDFVTTGSAGLAGPNFMAFRAARSMSTNIPGIGPLGPIEQRHLGLTFTEGPAADANGHVYFTDVQANRIYRSDTRGLLSVFLGNSSACNGLMFDQAGRLQACQRDQRRIIAIDPTTTNVTVVTTGLASRPLIGPNDLVVDSAGGTYFSDPNFAGAQTGPTQSVYYVSAAGAVSQVASNLSRPNGVLLSPDERTFYVLLTVVSPPGRLMSYPVLGPGVLGSPVTNFIPDAGDGMTIDTLGNLYLVQQNQRQILVRSPAGGTLGAITFPEAPANCTFGGSDMRTLFVTARTSVYVCRMATTGHRFAGNPSSYVDFQRKFFGTTNGVNTPTIGRAADPDGDGASNELEYLTRTHPLLFEDAWRIGLESSGAMVRIVFPQLAGRGFEVQSSGALGPAAWELLNGPGNPVPVSVTNGTGVVEDVVATGTNRFYRVRVSE